MKKKLALGTVILVASICFGCTNNEIYDFIQSDRQAECYKLPQPQYEDCMKRTSESYENYKQKRDDAIHTEKH